MKISELISIYDEKLKKSGLTKPTQNVRKLQFMDFLLVVFADNVNSYDVGMEIASRYVENSNLN